MNAIIYKKFDQQLFKEWFSLWKKSSFANYANSPQWFKAALETFNYKEYVIIAIYDHDALVGIAPLVKEKVYGIALYTGAAVEYIYGIPFLTDWNNQKVASLLFKKVISLGPIFLTNIPEFFVEVFKKKKCNSKVIKQAINYYLSLVINESNVLQIKNRKKLLHNARHIIEKFVFNSFEGDSSEGIAAVFSIDAKSRKKNRGYSTFSTQEAKKLYELLAKYFKNYLAINILYYEKTPIAYEIGFKVRKTYYGSQTAFVEEYKKYSPGKVITLRLLDYLATQNIKKIDFGSGESGVKRMLTSDSQQLYQVILSSNAFIKTYILSMLQLRNYTFDQVNKYESIYTVYRKIKSILA